MAKTAMWNLVDDKCICMDCGLEVGNRKDCNKLYHNCSAKPSYPSLVEMAKNVTTSVIDYAVSGFENAAEEEQNRRLEICRGCELFDKVQERCIKCGCYANLKTIMKSGKCPIDKW